LNNWSADYFHGRCDNKGATVVVVKTGNYIFGGCTVRSWGGSGEKKASDSFLFSLVNPSGLSPTKIPLIAGQEEKAIYCNKGYGPVFGSGYDLYIAGSPNSNNCSTTLNVTVSGRPGCHHIFNRK